MHNLQYYRTVSATTGDLIITPIHANSAIKRLSVNRRSAAHACNFWAAGDASRIVVVYLYDWQQRRPVDVLSASPWPSMEGTTAAAAAVAAAAIRSGGGLIVPAGLVTRPVSFVRARSRMDMSKCSPARRKLVVVTLHSTAFFSIWTHSVFLSLFLYVWCALRRFGSLLTCVSFNRIRRAITCVLVAHARRRRKRHGIRPAWTFAIRLRVGFTRSWGCWSGARGKGAGKARVRITSKD